MLYPGAEFIPPAAQHMGNGRVGIGRPMGGMGVVHRDHIGDQIGIANEPREIRHRVQPAAGLQQEGRMIDIAQPHSIRRQRITKAGMVQIFDPRSGIRHRDTMAGNTLLCGGGPGAKGKNQRQVQG